MKFKKPQCMFHQLDEPMCNLLSGGECGDPFYTACPSFSAVPYECLHCSHPYNHDDIPEVCVECFYELTAQDKIQYEIVE